MTTNLDVIRKADKSLIALLLGSFYRAKEDNDEVLIDVCESLDSIIEWLDYPIDNDLQIK